MLNTENKKWLEAHKKRTGRPPSILHIGNIANNAYNNSKLMRQAGFDSDVICYDYFHIMGCPEWEEADFDGRNLDHFHPEWEKVNLGSYRRPSWFIQGPLEAALQKALEMQGKRRDKLLRSKKQRLIFKVIFFLKSRALSLLFSVQRKILFVRHVVKVFLKKNFHYLLIKIIRPLVRKMIAKKN